MKTLEDVRIAIEAKYPRAIRFEKTKRFSDKTAQTRKETLQEFLAKVFTEWNDEKNTIYVDDKSIQTGTGKRRSLGDIYMLCKYYYPTVTIRDVLFELYVGLRDYFDSHYRTSYCHTINKRVWYYDEDAGSGIYNKELNDEYGKKYNWYLKLVTSKPVIEEDEDEEVAEEVVCEDCGELWDECTCD